MSKNLVIVESPAKAKTIEKFLGADFKVKSCNGHVRDLATNKLSINVESNFAPEYLVLKEKQKIIKDLKEDAKKADFVWLATDEDREGEAISWHLSEILGLTDKNTKRIVFHEITKDAILDAVSKPRKIDQDLVNAQQARRILDRLVGFKVSPVLWKKVKPALSAGRVQSVAVRLIVEREREIINFKSTNYYKVVAEFTITDDKNQVRKIKSELSERLANMEDARSFLEDCAKSDFSVAKVEQKSAKKNPSPPFTTSTLQQEASRKLGYSVSQTMQVAQKLYEAGHITYMRTDSVRLSNLALGTAKQEITEIFGANYSQTRNYQTKSKSAQEAHEAIRPTYIKNREISVAAQESKLYDLIWKRTVASQMAEAQIDKTIVKISISQNSKQFTATGEVIKFDGFLKLYIESTDDENGNGTYEILPPLTEGQTLNLAQLTATEKFTRAPFRYTEASLVKKMEELGIGRPSTYAPTISTIQKREYVNKDYKDGKERAYTVLSLDNQLIVQEESKTEIVGADKNKLTPSSIGMIVNDFLVTNFEAIVDFNFTAAIENEFDEIAIGKLDWQKMIDLFYKDFEPTVSKAEKVLYNSSGERQLGLDPKTGLEVSAKLGRYGPFIQLGSSKDEETKPKYARLKRGQLLENITLEEALDLLKLPRDLGLFEEDMIFANIGRFGPFVGNKKAFYSIPKELDPYEINLEEAIEVIKIKREVDKNKLINEYEHEGEIIKVLNGRWGPYISYKKQSYKIAKEIDPKTLTLESSLELIKNTAPAVKKGGRRAKSK
ncbi:MAG: type I DNA topoisomerase [Cytophagia bacterium]|nr:type I DNA topoisomerase [Cytophagia bacterium]